MVFRSDFINPLGKGKLGGGMALLETFGGQILDFMVSPYWLKGAIIPGRELLSWGKFRNVVIKVLGVCNRLKPGIRGD